MSGGTMNQAVSREQLSALVDGELDDAGVSDACAGWYADPGERATWHAYQLIGDVMRSEDLASDAGSDADFLAALRDRLAREPVVLAPAPRLAGSTDAGAVAVESAPAGVAVRRRLVTWRASAAVAAGFVAVAGVLVATRGTDPAPQVAAVPAPAAVRPVVAVAPAPAPAPRTVAVEPAADVQVLVVNGQLIRDAQLDRYLAAHKQFSGSSALGVPSTFLRSATSDASNR